MARLAEEAGFDSLWVTDHLIHRTEPDGKTVEVGATCGTTRALGVLVDAGGASAITSRVEIGTLVLRKKSQSRAAGQDGGHGR